jgi:hypothetical protein
MSDPEFDDIDPNIVSGATAPGFSIMVPPAALSIDPPATPDHAQFWKRVADLRCRIDRAQADGPTGGQPKGEAVIRGDGPLVPPVSRFAMTAAHSDDTEIFRGITDPGLSLLFDHNSPDGRRRLAELSRYWRSLELSLDRAGAIDFEAKRAARKHLRERTL